MIQCGTKQMQYLYYRLSFGFKLLCTCPKWRLQLEHTDLTWIFNLWMKLESSRVTSPMTNFFRFSPQFGSQDLTVLQKKGQREKISSRGGKNISQAYSRRFSSSKKCQRQNLFIQDYTMNLHTLYSFFCMIYNFWLKV